MFNTDAIRRQLLAVSGAVLFTLLFLAAGVLNAQLQTVVLLLCFYWAGTASVYLLGWKMRNVRRWSAQILMIWTIACITLAMWKTPQLRPVLLFAYLAVAPFAMLLSAWRSVLLVLLLIWLGYTSGIWPVLLQHSQTGLDHSGLLLLAGFSLVLIATALAGREVLFLRQSYVRKHHELRHALERLEELSTRDSLTGLFNRRYLINVIARYRSMAARHGSCFSVIVIEISTRDPEVTEADSEQWFVRVAQTLALQIRELDLAARLQDRRFALLLTDTPESSAVLVVNRIRNRLGPLYRVAAGVCQYQAGEEGSQLIERATALMEEADALPDGGVRGVFN